MQRIINPRSGKQCQRMHPIPATRRFHFVSTVDDAVIHLGQIRQIEDIRQQPQMFRIKVTFDVDAIGKRKCTGIGNSLTPTSSGT